MKLSIVIPIYNVEKYLAKCLDSVIYPNLPDYEIIGVNDGSTDSSGEILADYVRRYPALVRAVTQENGGLGCARNSGLAVAKGEYVQFLDSDDTLLDGAVREILALTEKGMDVCLFDLVGVDEQGRQISYTKGSRWAGPFTLSEHPEQLLHIPHACNKFFRRELFERTGLRFPGRLWFEDIATTPKLLLNAERICYVEKPWYRYLQRQGSILNNPNTKRNLEIIEAVDTTLDYFRVRGVFEQYRDQLCYMTAFHQLIVTSVRVNQIDPKSEVLSILRDNFVEKFPDYSENPYFRQQSPKYKLLAYLILNRRQQLLYQVMRLNNLRKKLRR